MPMAGYGLAGAMMAASLFADSLTRGRSGP
jgi:hypothetical protein